MDSIIKFLLIAIILFFISCNVENNKELTVKDIEIFKDTPAWDLAKTLEISNIKEAEKLILNNKDLLNYQESIFGTTLLMRAVSTRKYNVVRFLLQNGANPNVKSKTGTTAIFRAISHSWKDVNVSEDSKFVKILLENGADPNIPYCGTKIEGQIDPIECGTSPLIHAAIRGIEKTKLLIAAGSDINYKTKSGKTAAINALLMQSVETAHYLIVKKKAKITDPYYYYEFGHNTIVNYNEPHFPIELLEDWLFDLGSVKHRMKMEIIEEFKRQGEDYWSITKHPKTIERIKKLYPNNWQDYLEKY
jgi:predicted regulator of amino acid metabolism with ACT domain